MAVQRGRWSWCPRGAELAVSLARDPCNDTQWFECAGPDLGRGGGVGRAGIAAHDESESVETPSGTDGVPSSVLGFYSLFELWTV